MFQRSLLCSRISISLLLFLGLSLSLQSQALNYCGTQGIDEEWEAFSRNNPNLITRSFGDELYVALTVHVLGEDNGSGYHPISTIFKSLQRLNEDFEASGIQFYLGSPINYINNTAWYDHENFSVGAQMMIANNVPRTINCYIVNNAAENCGYRSFAGDAIALTKSCTQANDHTWAHEIGHYLSLPHTFFGWEGTEYNDEEDTPSMIGSRPVEKVDRSNCSQAADKICDTPVDYLSFRWGCNDRNEYPDSLRDPDGVKFAVDGSLFMSYAFDNCQSRFSEEQSEEMRVYLENRIPETVLTSEPKPLVNPSETKLVYPIQGERVDNVVKLEWEEQGTGSIYIVEVSKFPQMSIPSLRQLVYGNSLEVFGLGDNEDYYWRLRTLNEFDFEYNNTTVVESFTTGELSNTEEYYAENLSIFPNPIQAGDYLQIYLETTVSDEIRFNVFNLEGKMVLSKPTFLNSGSNYIEMESTSLAKGIYILKGVGELHNFQKKIVVE